MLRFSLFGANLTRFISASVADLANLLFRSSFKSVSARFMVSFVPSGDYSDYLITLPVVCLFPLSIVIFQTHNLQIVSLDYLALPFTFRVIYLSFWDLLLLLKLDRLIFDSLDWLVFSPNLSVCALYMFSVDFSYFLPASFLWSPRTAPILFFLRSDHCAGSSYLQSSPN